jgi:hypothetical protein
MERLHFGCFNRPVEGWTNTDVTPHLLIARVPGLPWLLRRLGRMDDEHYAEHREGVFGRVRSFNVVWRRLVPLHRVKQCASK